MSIYNQNYYVYMYLRPNLTPYYIGKGSGKRAFIKAKNHYPPKDKDLVFFIKENLNEEQAFYWEKYYIKQYGRKDNGTGILRNLTDGGIGAIGGKQSKESINKRAKQLSKKYIIMTPDGTIIYIENLNQFCIEHNLDRRHLYKVANGKVKCHNKYQMRFIKDLKQFPFYNLEELNSSKPKTIRAINTITNETRIYNSVNECCNELNLKQPNMSAVLNGRLKTTGGWTCEVV